MQAARKTQPQLEGAPSEGGSLLVYLRDVSAFADIRDNDVALGKLARIMKSRNYAPGEVLIEEGKPGSEMFLLLEGSATVQKKTLEGETYPVVILRGEKHAVFGESGVIGADPRSATIVAESACRCLLLDRESFHQFGAEHPEWALPIVLKITQSLIERLRRANEDSLLLYNALVKEIRGH